METYVLYLLCLYGTGLCFALWKALFISLPFLRVKVARYLTYPLLFQGRRYRSPTRLQALLCLSYLLGNLSILLFPFYPFPSLNEVQRRAGLISIVNLLPTLLGKQFFSALQVFYISSNNTQLIHLTISAVFSLESLLHSSIRLSQKPVSTQQNISGISSFTIIITIALTSFWIVQRLLKHYFVALHLVLCTALFGALLWHSLLTSSVIFKALASLQSFILSLILTRYTVRHVFRSKRAVVKDVYFHKSIVVIKIRTQKPVRVFPGCQFYLSLPSLSSFSHYPRQPFWSVDEGVQQCQKARNLTFVVPVQRRRTKEIRSLEPDQQVHISGPYGTDLNLQKYEDVALLCKGTGILGVMSQALTLCSRRHHDESIRQSIKELQEEQNTLESELEKAKRHQLNKSESSKRRQKADDLSQRLADLRTEIKARKEITLFNDYTRRIDLLWVLEHGDQAAWAADAFKSLQELDPKNKMLVVWCLYPEPVFEPKFGTSSYWQCFNPGDRPSDAIESIRLRIRDRRNRAVGKIVVCCCGEMSFSQEIRTIIVESMERSSYIEFREIDFSSNSSV